MPKTRYEPNQERKRRLKLSCFQRDGWLEVVQTKKGPKKVWFAHCAFGCGCILWLETATLDHYPIPYKYCGDWKVSNLRLACQPCNTGQKSNGEDGKLAFFMPHGLSNEEKIKWHRQFIIESAWLNGMHGLPIDLMYPD